MIQSVQIQNFKSVVDLTLELGSFNVLIGANGCGKSNILEAIAFGAAASANKLDKEFLGSRGIRLTSPEFMFSAFITDTKQSIVSIRFSSNDEQYAFDLIADSYNSKGWIDLNRESIIHLGGEAIPEILRIVEINEKEEKIKKLFTDNQRIVEVIESISKPTHTYTLDNEFLHAILNFTSKLYNPNKYISNYILYSPEQTSLRKFEDTNQIYPLGVKGEGLFQYLKELSLDEKNAEVLNEIKECLLLLDWYEDFKMPQNLMSNEFALSIKDKYLNENLQFFDQRSTNEGFLFLLFYATLFTSKETPAFFAIDNIDTSFNPKLCMQVTKMLAELAKKHGKQVIVTTQNPAILDGLDLTDDSQRLFVVRRNEEGHTKAKRIEYKAERTMKLSEVWTNGFIGGLPDNF